MTARQLNAAARMQTYYKAPHLNVSIVVGVVANAGCMTLITCDST